VFQRLHGKTPSPKFHNKKFHCIEKLFFFAALNYFNPFSSIIEMKKNSHISPSHEEVILHAYNKRGFFVTPVSVIFSVRPIIPFWVRR